MTVSAQDYVDGLLMEALSHPAVRHPYLLDLGAGRLPDLRFALKDFARHYYGYSAHFPRYLAALISRLEQLGHRYAVLEILAEESGHYQQEELDELARLGLDPAWIVGIPHPELFQRFRHGLGVVPGSRAVDHIEVVCWREQLLALLGGSTAAEALGALGLGSESIVHTIYQPLLQAIAAIGLPPRDSVFFHLHTGGADHYQATLRPIAIDFAATSKGRLDLAKGMRKALALRSSFWSWLHGRALNPGALPEGDAPAAG
jgi:hypothetical protein